MNFRSALTCWKAYVAHRKNSRVSSKPKSRAKIARKKSIEKSSRIKLSKRNEKSLSYDHTTKKDTNNNEETVKSTQKTSGPPGKPKLQASKKIRKFSSSKHKKKAHMHRSTEVSVFMTRESHSEAQAMNLESKQDIFYSEDPTQGLTLCVCETCGDTMAAVCILKCKKMNMCAECVDQYISINRKATIFGHLKRFTCLTKFQRMKKYKLTLFLNSVKGGRLSFIHFFFSFLFNLSKKVVKWMFRNWKLFVSLKWYKHRSKQCHFHAWIRAIKYRKAWKYRVVEIQQQYAERRR